MSKLLNRSLKSIVLYAALILVLSIPVYYIAISILWEYELDEHNIILTPEASREDVMLLITAVTLLSVLFFLLLLGGFVLINRNISRKIWQPFYRSLSSIRQFDLTGDKPVEFDSTDIEEFSELNDSLGKLLAANSETYRQQKEFADNASHELQTPLAIAQSKLEMLLQSSSLTGDENKVVEDALRAIARAGRINKNLLLLTKIENSQFMDQESVNISEAIDKVCEQSEYFSEDRQINIAKQIDQNVIVTGNRMLIEIMLQNLVNNAIRHGPDRNQVLITLSCKKLTVENAGEISLDRNRLFKRFATASSQTPGTGLGLVIVKQICQRYHWKIEYGFANGKHGFSIQFYRLEKRRLSIICIFTFLWAVNFSIQ